MTRLMLVRLLFAATAAAAVTYKDPEAIARASDKVAALLHERPASPPRAVQIPRGQGGEFALRAQIKRRRRSDGHRYRRDLGRPDL